MRLGAWLFKPFSNPEEWVAVLREYGYTAAYSPVGVEAAAEEIAAYREAAARADIIIAEVGVWRNVFCVDPAEQQANREYAAQCLHLADQLGARCCVNVASHFRDAAGYPDERGFSEDTFAAIVDYTRDLLDTVQPTQTYYTIETLPEVFPDSPDEYLRLLRAVDRPQFGVHLDVANMVNSTRRYFNTASLIRDSFAKLGPYIRCCHAKDLRMTAELGVHIEEVRPGLGKMDYRTYFRELSRLDPDIPVMIEHLPDEAEYVAAADYLRQMATAVGETL